VKRKNTLKQLGNSVAINAIKAWGDELIKSLDGYYKK
jgi:site-specific DNA-cytosine methylase